MTGHHCASLKICVLKIKRAPPERFHERFGLLQHFRKIAVGMGSLLVLIHMCNDVLPTACEDLPPSIRVPAQPLPHNFLMYQLSTHPFVDPGNSKQRTRKTNQCLFDWTSNKVHQKSVFPDSINCNGEIGRHGTPPSQKKIATIFGFFPVRETWTWFCFTLDFFALLMAVDLRGPFCQQSE